MTLEFLHKGKCRRRKRKLFLEGDTRGSGLLLERKEMLRRTPLRTSRGGDGRDFLPSAGIPFTFQNPTRKGERFISPWFFWEEVRVTKKRELIIVDGCRSCWVVLKKKTDLSAQKKELSRTREHREKKGG